MILHLDPDLTPRDRASLVNAGAYLEHRGVPDSALAIAPPAGMQDEAWLQVTYDPWRPDSPRVKHHDDLNADIVVRNGSDSGLRFSCSLFEATCAAVALTTTKLGEAAASARITDTLAQISDRLGLRDLDFFKDHMAKWSPGVYVSPEGQGYSCYLVDTYGEVAILARAGLAAPIVIFYAANRVFESEHLLDKMLAFRRSRGGAGVPADRPGAPPARTRRPS